MTAMTMKWIRGEGTAAEEWSELGYVELDDGQRLAVESEADTESPFKSRWGKGGKKQFWQSVRTLLLENGDLMYGCADCWYAAESPRSVMPHRNAHRPPIVVESEERVADAVTDNAMTIEDFEPVEMFPDEPVIELQNAPQGDDLATATWAVGILVERAKLLDEMIADRDAWQACAESWETRAKAAEKTLNKIRRAMPS